MNRITMLALVIGLVVLAAPLLASAQCINVVPENWDYGDVKVGTSESQIFTIENCMGSDLFIFYIEITEDDTGAFSIASAPSEPIIPGWESRDVEVTFTPPSLGAHDTFLWIVSDVAEPMTGSRRACVEALVSVRGWDPGRESGRRGRSRSGDPPGPARGGWKRRCRQLSRAEGWDPSPVS